MFAKIATGGTVIGGRCQGGPEGRAGPGRRGELTFVSPTRQGVRPVTHRDRPDHRHQEVCPCQRRRSASTTRPRRPAQQGRAPRRRSAARRPSPRRSRWLPYLLLLPAVLLELLIHIVPMVVGIWMSFVKLTQFYIANWSAAPWAGLDNYAVAVDFDARVGEALLQSFLVTVAFSLLAVGAVLGARDGGGGRAAAAVPRPRPRCGRCSSSRTRCRSYAGSHHLELHAPARHRPGEPRPRRQLAPRPATGRSG